MLLFRENLLSIPIISLQTGRKVAQIDSIILNPNSFSVAAFDVSHGRQKRVLFADDIKEITAKMCVIDDDTQLMENEDLVRLDSLRSLDYTLIGKKVRTVGGIRVGKVRDWVCDTTTFEIAKLHVKQSVRKDLNVGVVIVDRDQVKELRKKRVIVSDSYAKQTSNQKRSRTNKARPPVQRTARSE